MRQALIVKWNRPVLRLYPFADLHFGSKEHRIKQLAIAAQALADDDDGLGIGLGDWIEAIAATDKRFDPEELATPIEPEHLNNPFYCQALAAVKATEKTKGKWIAHLMGNHELTAQQRYFFSPIPIIAERLGGAYLGGTDCCGWVRIKMCENDKVRNIVDVWASHGYGGGELRGGSALRLQRLLMRKQADVVLVGHGHKPTLFPETVEYIDRRGIECEHTRLGIENFPFVGKHGYLARKGGNAPAPGYIVVEIERVHNQRLARISANIKLL